MSNNKYIAIVVNDLGYKVSINGQRCAYDKEGKLITIAPPEDFPSHLAFIDVRDGKDGNEKVKELYRKTGIFATELYI
ncbi:hypothetical protein NVB27_002958 [Salmonella enterica]|uniref:hypothetical protein n=1 Tax=Salmonella enterica TaxID=28901 RepID=UPI0003BCF464|nr:hypothetical protein [Salmonella enterica]ESJ21363.1 hypothetical protein SED60170_05097 [Salmonella enterica subsp. diarizonae serovar 60:r:e,n,x,z15 str. 01-0170]EAP6366480.1 hypothetical protein [Salmonella enterica]EAT5390136.1 hypothetical protein [Salmonella enterica]EBK5909176.1 hypothetical protein [Salmonella enterica]EDX6844804.1 hypothetical protein [Salmonella enterica]